jgi:hypothetical protein
MFSFAVSRPGGDYGGGVHAPPPPGCWSIDGRWLGQDRPLSIGHDTDTSVQPKVSVLFIFVHEEGCGKP